MRVPFALICLACLAAIGACGDADAPDNPTTTTTMGQTGSTSSGMGGASGVGGSGAGGVSSVGKNCFADTGSLGGGSSVGQGGGITGMGGTLIIQGTIVTPDTVIEGEVQINGDTIVCVEAGTGCSDADPAAGVFENAGVIAPGLIDSHNHILFDIFNGDDWSPHLPTGCTTDADCDSSTYCSTGSCACVDAVCKYRDHNEWTNETEYAQMLDYKQCLADDSQGKPVWCPLAYDGDGKLKCEMNKWGELKGLIAGTTSIVGLPGLSAACFGSLARSIDVSQNDLPGDQIQTSSLFPPSGSSANGVCANFADGDTDAYLIHVGEGTNDSALSEFSTLDTVSTPDGCLLSAKTTITHGTAFGQAQFEAMAAANMKLTWSPASNVSLYGSTTDIPAALAAGLTVALAPDWSMGGSQNLLDELRFANCWDDSRWGDVLSSKTLVEMVTSNAAEAIGLGSTLGHIAVGHKADLMVVVQLAADPYDSVVAATPSDVRLVMVGGVALYGDASIQAIAPAVPGCEAVDICGASKFLCAAEPSSVSTDKFDQTFAEIGTALGDAIATLDAITALPPGDCSPACAQNEECFVRTLFPQIAESNCAAPCGADEACFQTAQSGNNMFNCLTLNACSPAKTESFAPLTPIVACQ